MMPGRKHSTEQLIRKLRQAEVLPAEGATVDEAYRSLEVRQQTSHRWRRELGGVRVSRA